MIAPLAVAVALAAQAQAPGKPPCPAEQPAAMRLTALPAVLVAGRAYEVGLEPTGAGEAVAAHGATLAVYDRTGRGWSAEYGRVPVRQAFSVGLTGAPYRVEGRYSEVLGDGTCTRTLAVSVAVERRVLGVVGCRRGAVAPRSGIVLDCDRDRPRLRLRGITWRGWNGDVAVGRAGGVRVTLSHPRECAALDGFIYTRARLNGRGYAIDCPIL